MKTEKRRLGGKKETVRDKGVKLEDPVAIHATGEDRANRSTEEFNNKYGQELYNAMEYTEGSQQEGRDCRTYRAS